MSWFRIFAPASLGGAIGGALAVFSCELYVRLKTMRVQLANRRRQNEYVESRLPEMIADRHRQDAEIRAKYGRKDDSPVLPLSKQELNAEVAQMIRDRHRQDEELMAKYGSATK